jgi:integrase
MPLKLTAAMRELGIYIRGPRYWLQYKGERTSLGTADPEAAILAARDRHRSAADPTYAAARETTLLAACEEWQLAAPTAGNREKPPSPHTLAMQRTHMGHLCRILGDDLQLARLDVAARERYVRERRTEGVGKLGRKRVKATTVDKELGTLRKVLRHAAEQGRYHHPIDVVIPPAAGVWVPLERALTLEQVPLLLAQLSPRRAATCAYIVAFGADWCAVERAERWDIGTERICHRAALIRGTKNSKRWAEVPIVPPFGPFAELARQWLVTNGSLYTWGKGDRSLERACTRAGVPRVTPRDLRRTHGQILADRGVPPFLIGEMLRHSDSRMAERAYGQRKREAVARQVVQSMGR